MRRATREARTLAISAHAAAMATRAVANMPTRRVFPSLDAKNAEQEAERYWLRLARTLKWRG